MIQLSTAALLFMSVAPAARAQSFNLDLGPGGAEPSPAHAAAGFQPGFWNPFSDGGPLAGLDGAGGWTVAASASGSSFAEVFLDNPATAGDDQALLDDGVRLAGAQSSYVVELATLQPGEYLVYTYTIAPDSNARTTVTVPLATSRVASAGGTWNGAHAEGVTYTRHHVSRPGCCLQVDVRPEADEGFVAGIQLVRLEDSVDALCQGTQSSCPCGNAGAGDGGCASSANAAGAVLESDGAQIVGEDSFRLTAAGVPASAMVLFFEGSVDVAPVAAGDGARCAGGSLIRLGARTASFGSASFPGPGDLSISARTLVQPGERRVYQAWYRDPAAFCTSATFNLSGALAATWR
jgi:hypothetical protein